MRRKALYNSISTICLQFFTCIIGLIIPSLIMRSFGSEVNGITQSITQFLNYIVLLESGVGGVVRAAMYKPLAVKDYDSLGGIISATEQFFRKIAYAFIGYMLILAIIYPNVGANKFSYLFSASLVIIIGISTIAQYYFGITYQILLDADQNSYIINSISTVMLIINAILAFVLIKLGFGIQIVKLSSAFIFCVKPLILNIYVKHKYKLIDFHSKPNNDLIRQRWDGLGQHLAFFVYNNTDIVVLTLFSNFKVVSIYSIYYMIVSGLSNLMSFISSAFTPILGRFNALEDKVSLGKTVRMYELSCFILSNIIFTVTAFVIIPFMRVYTSGIRDANYINYAFGFLMSAYAFVLLVRNIYQNVVLSAGHFKQTNIAAYVETAINIIISLALVKKLGLCGVTIGTILGLSFKTIYYVFYLKKNILLRSTGVFFKQLSVSVVCIVINSLIYFSFRSAFRYSNYFEWCITALATTMVIILTVLIIHLIFYKDEMIEIFKKIRTSEKKNNYR